MTVDRLVSGGGKGWARAAGAIILRRGVWLEKLIAILCGSLMNL